MTAAVSPPAFFLWEKWTPRDDQRPPFPIKHYAVRYGIDPDTMYPHSFRHRFAKNFLARSSDISLLADLLGHESIETTRIYLTRSSKEQKLLLDQDGDLVGPA